MRKLTGVPSQNGRSIAIVPDNIKIFNVIFSFLVECYGATIRISRLEALRRRQIAIINLKVAVQTIPLWLET